MKYSLGASEEKGAGIRGEKGLLEEAGAGLVDRKSGWSGEWGAVARDGGAYG